MFREGFGSPPPHTRYLDGAALVLMIITISLLITPETYHQIVDTGADSRRFHRFISRMAACALLSFALSLGAALFITGEHVFGLSAGLATTCFSILLALSSWYALPYLRWFETGHRERAISARQQTMTESTPLDQQIVQMLTEARVILPGVQALFGFQLISVVRQSCEKLPASSKVVHASSLGCITIAVILLIAPAAYHQIVFRGQDAEEVHRVGSLFVTGATIPVVLGLAGDIYVVSAEITASPIVGMFVASVALGS